MVDDWVEERIRGHDGPARPSPPPRTASRPSPSTTGGEAEGAYLPLTLDVLRITGGEITEIVTFHADQFPRFGLPERLPARREGGDLMTRRKEPRSSQTGIVRSGPTAPARPHRPASPRSPPWWPPPLVAALARAAGVDFEVPEGGETIPLSGFAVVTGFFSLVGVVLAAALLRWSAHPAERFVQAAVSLTAISLVPPLLSGAAAATIAALVVLHLVAAAVMIPALARGLRR